MAAARRSLRYFVVLLVFITLNTHAMMRYVVSAFRTPAERALWMYAVQRPDISEMTKVLQHSNVNPNFVTTVWDGTWPPSYEAMTPLAMAAVCGNMPVIRALLESRRVDVNKGGRFALQHSGAEVTCLDRVVNATQVLQKRIDCIRAAGVEIDTAGGHLGESLQRELNVQRRVAQILREAGGATTFLDDNELKWLLEGLQDGH